MPGQDQNDNKKMKLPLSWLKDYLKYKETPEQLAQLLTMSGTEVTSIDKAGGQIDDQVVVAEVVDINKHPNADKLQLVTVKTDKGQQKVVCGAFNFKVGDKVPLAQAGAVLANGITLKKATIRGVESNGMLCAEDELGLGDDHNGILILDKAVKLGTRVNQVLGGQEIVFDIDLTPNRPDCLSIIGLAREAAAVTDNKIQIKEYKLKEAAEKIKLSVKVIDKAACPLYSARVIKGISIKESPVWLQERLLASGVRPINNIVDVTNYIMLETGQPLHAFDAHGIQEIVVRKAKAGEKLKTLDEQDRKLDSSMLLITDGQKPIALAGVMGGFDSEIKEGTKDIILESACFDPQSVRKTSQQLNLRSESSLRFEKGIDGSQTLANLDRAAALLQEVGGGQVQKGQAVAGSAKSKEVTVDLDPDHVSKLLGIAVPKATIVDYLARFGFKVSGSNKLKVNVPSWRQADISMEADLIEEVGRLYDYNKMKPTNLLGELSPPQPNERLEFIEKVRDILAIAGMIETYSYSFYGRALNNQPHLEIANPLSEEQKLMRTSFQEVIPMMTHNLNYYDELKMFEIGNLYFPQGKNGYKENPMIYGLVSTKKNDNAFFQAKGLVTFLTRHLNVKDYSSALVEMRMINNKEIAAYKASANTAFFLLDLEKLRELRKPKQYKEFSAFPEVIRDIAFWIDKKHSYSKIKKCLANIDPLLIKIECFDVFADKKDPQRHSLALRFTWQSPKKTLKSEETDKILDKIIKKLEQNFQIELRSKT